MKRFDPRTALLITLLSLLALLLVNSGWKFGLAILFCAVLNWKTARLRLWLRYSSLLAPLVILLVLFGFFAGELTAAISSSLKILALSSVAFCFFQLVPPEELAFALLKWRLPFGITFVVAYSLRYVEMIKREWQALREAQQLRGRGLQGWGWRHLPDFLGLLLVQVFRLADELAEALESRGFGAPARTLPADFRLGRSDYLALLISSLTLTIFIFY